MADERHVDDTLFFVAEEDFRLYRADCAEFGDLTKPHVPMVEQAKWQEAQLSEAATLTPSDSSATRGSAPVAVDEPFASTRDVGEGARGSEPRLYARATKPKPGEMKFVSGPGGSREHCYRGEPRATRRSRVAVLQWLFWSGGTEGRKGAEGLRC